MTDQDQAGAEGPTAASAGRRLASSKSLRRGVVLFVLVLVAEYLVLPELTGIGADLKLLSHVNLTYLGIGTMLEFSSLLTYAQLTRAVLPPGGPNLWTALRVDMSTLSLSHVVPAGSAAGTGLGYRLLTEAGVSGADAGFALGAQGIGSALVLNVLLWAGLVFSIPAHGLNPLYGFAAVAGALLLGIFAVLVVLLTRGQERTVQLLTWIGRKAPLLDGASVEGAVRRLTERLRQLTADRRLMARGGAWASLTWLLHAASLWVFLAAFGLRVAPDDLLVAYSLAFVLSAVPITPGGLGVVEGVLVSVLVGFGSPKGAALIGVISYRLVNFWLPIPAGALTYLSLKADSGLAALARVREELERVAAQSRREPGHGRNHWRQRHGTKSARDRADEPPG